MKAFNHKMKGLDPVADAFAGTVYTDIVAACGAGLLATIYKGAGATGTSTVTVEACDDVTPTTSTAVAFMYRACTSGDTWGAWTQATTAGFATTAGASQLYEIFVPASEIGAEGYTYARLKFVEVENDPVLGGVLLEVVKPNYAPVGTTQIT